MNDGRFTVTIVTPVGCSRLVSLFGDTGQVFLRIELNMLLGPLDENRVSNRSIRDKIEPPFAALLREDFVSTASKLLDKVAVG